MVSNGIIIDEIIANIHNNENRIYEFKTYIDYRAPQIYGIKIPPVLPMPFAKPIPVVLNRVG